MKRTIPSLLLLLLAAPALADEEFTDYSAALRTARRKDKPILALFFKAKSPEGIRRVLQKIGKIADSFVLLEANKDTRTGRDLFRIFEIGGDQGYVVIERSQKWQFSRYERSLKESEIKLLMERTAKAKGKPEVTDILAVSQRELDGEVGPSQVTFCPT